MHARAELPARIALEWHEESACERSPALDDEVNRLLGPTFSAHRATHIRARVRESPSGAYELDLTVTAEGTRAHRHVAVASCDEANEAAALLIATALDPSAALRADEPTPARAPEPPPPVRPAAPEAAPPSPAERVQAPDVDLAQPASWWLLAKARLDTGSLPGASGGPAVGLEHARDRLSLWGEARLLLPRAVRSELAEVSARLDLYSGALGASYAWALGPIAVGPAAALELGLLRARGEGPDSLDDRVLWLEGYAGLISAMTLRPWLAITAELFAGVPFRRPRLARDRSEPFYITRAFTVQAALGVRVALGGD